MITKESIKSMSLKEKIAHMIIYRAGEFQERLDEMLENGTAANIGGVFIPSDKRDIDSAVELMNKWRAKAKYPLFFFVDAEWGVAQIFPDGTRLSPVMAVGASENAEELAYLHGNVVGRECAALGYRIVSNPTVDVNIEPKNPIICTRAFSDDTDTVIRLSRAYIKGVQDAGVICNAKHYPGHGATAVDSHMAMPEVRRTKEELYDVELRPYKEMCNDMWGVMTAHIHYPALAGEGEEGVPATLSRTMLYDILRGEFGYDNLIISDSLTMKGIKDKYGLHAAVGAIKAGHDIILQDYMTDPQITFDLVMNAAKSGEIPMEWIDESVYRIMKFKEQLGCMSNEPVDVEAARKILGCEEHVNVSKRIARESITPIESSSLPLDTKSAGKTLVIATVGPEEERAMADLGDCGGRASLNIANAIKAYCTADAEYVSELPEKARVDELIELAKGYDTVVVAAFVRTSSYKENSGKLSPEITRLLEAVGKSSATLVSLILGSPYAIADIPEQKNCLVAYSDDIYCIDAIVDALFGKAEARGHLPVNVSEKYPRGYSCRK